MLPRGGLVLLDRSRFFEFEEPGRTAQLVYRGFDGLVWPGGLPGFDVPKGLAPWSFVRKVFQRAREVEARIGGVLDVVAIEPTLATAPSEGEIRRCGETYSLLGYDVGYFDDEDSHYSVVLQEVLPRCCTELARFADELNGAGLFNDLPTARNCLRVRLALCRWEERLGLETLSHDAESLDVFGVLEPFGDSHSHPSWAGEDRGSGQG